MDGGNSREIRSLAQGSPPKTGAEPGATQAPGLRVLCHPLPPASQWFLGLRPAHPSSLPPARALLSVSLSVCLCVCRSLCSACLRPPSLLSGAAAAAPAGSHGALWTWTDCTLSVVTHSFLRDQALLPSLAGSLAVFPPVTSSSGPAGIGCVLSQLSSFWSSSFSLAPPGPRPVSSTPAVFPSGLYSKWAAPRRFPDSVLSSPPSTAAAPPYRKAAWGALARALCPVLASVLFFCFVFPVSFLACEVLRVAAVLIWCYLQPAHHWCSVNTH